MAARQGCHIDYSRVLPMGPNSQQVRANLIKVNMRRDGSCFFLFLRSLRFLEHQPAKNMTRTINNIKTIPRTPPIIAPVSLELLGLIEGSALKEESETDDEVSAGLEGGVSVSAAMMG